MEPVQSFYKRRADKFLGDCCMQLTFIKSFTLQKYILSHWLQKVQQVWDKIACFIHIDSYSKWIRQKFYQFFIKEKLKKTFYFLTYILPNYVLHDITKEFWKSSHFENMTAGFLLRSQNPLRWYTPEKMHFQEWNFSFSPTFPL